MYKTMVNIVSLEKIEIIRSQEFMPSKARLKILKKMIILGPKTAILGPQFCRILVLGPHFWWSGGALGPPGSAPGYITLPAIASHGHQPMVLYRISNICFKWDSDENIYFSTLQ